MFTFEGSELFTFADKKIRTEPGSVLYIPRGEAYRVELDGEKSSVVNLDFETAGAFPRPFYIKSNDANAAGGLFTRARIAWRKKSGGYVFECMSCLYGVIGLLAGERERYLDRSKYEKIEAALDHLRLHFSEPELKISDLYGDLGISPQYFERLFKRRFSVTPRQYLILLRIESAKDMLLGSEQGIKKISEMTGFCDVYHFCKVFKKHTGQSPGEFRKSAFLR
ncbi:MAG: helix-turn-helix domain-containing protein [Clostridia bacterium]|nr:helix-turn-helix domain-containing protein [Clostridia bacterium]